jgi:hypothetical protein
MKQFLFSQREEHKEKRDRKHDDLIYRLQNNAGSSEHMVR